MAAAQAAILAPHQIVAVNQFLFTPIAQHGFDIGRRLSDQRLSFLAPNACSGRWAWVGMRVMMLIRSETSAITAA